MRRTPRIRWPATPVALAALLLAAPALQARADIFAYTDPQGVTYYSNVPVDPRYELLIAAPPEPVAGDPTAAPSAAVLARAAQYDTISEEAARRSKVEPALLRAVIVVESAFNERAVSRTGAKGLMQLMPATAKHYGAKDAFDPGQNIHAGARYLRDLLSRYQNDLELVLAAYNAGENAVERHGRKIPPFRETRLYVPRVLGVYHNLSSVAQTD